MQAELPTQYTNPASPPNTPLFYSFIQTSLYLWSLLSMHKTQNTLINMTEVTNLAEHARGEANYQIMSGWLITFEIWNIW